MLLLLFLKYILFLFHKCNILKFSLAFCCFYFLWVFFGGGSYLFITILEVFLNKGQEETRVNLFPIQNSEQCPCIYILSLTYLLPAAAVSSELSWVSEMQNSLLALSSLLTLQFDSSLLCKVFTIPSFSFCLYLFLFIYLCGRVRS